MEIAARIPKQHAIAWRPVPEVLSKFYEGSGWRPRHVLPISGVLLYSIRNFLVRFIMKRTARKSGGSTDTSGDNEYTDWTALDQFLGTFTGQNPGAVVQT
jgi:menaquinone-dependent protoporphyrinogen oxidase